MSLLLETHVRAMSFVNISLSAPLLSFFFLQFKKINKQTNKETHINRNATQVRLQKCRRKAPRSEQRYESATTCLRQQDLS